ncbi:hypothetical protein V5O48_016859 [Marasmius crinis-equi]|uniref:mitogen-activated protein kinase kinase kinase n=1 Tax=Marasmius crinis-equi TaxID=585013 RepID=A0ABR3EQK8_9AGAR
MQQLIDYPNTSSELRTSIFTTMLRLSKTSGLHPKCLSIYNVKKLGEYPIASGGFGDVWKGVIGDSSDPVSLKIVKVYLKSDLKKLSNEYLREAILWRQMKHPNLLPFLGLYQLEQTHQLCLISPWMEKGNLVQFLRSTQREDVDHYMLAHDIASGLSYLHAKKILHGDLKGVNVLVTDSFRACIGDFGLARIADTHALKITSSASRPIGTARWLAPELLIGASPSKESDMYSYACVCYEIFTGGLQPFPELPNEMAVAFQVAQGKRPSRPEEKPELSDAMWSLMQTCWDANPASRPTAGYISEQVADMRTSASPALDWKESVFTQVWGNVDYPSLASETPDTPRGKDKTTLPDAERGESGGAGSQSTPMKGTSSKTGVAICQALSLYSYTAKDSYELSFETNEILDILHKQTGWWRVRKGDGTLGIAASDEISFLEGPSQLQETDGIIGRAKALRSSRGLPNESGFLCEEGETLDILEEAGGWWEAQKPDGTMGREQLPLRLRNAC